MFKLKNLVVLVLMLVLSLSLSGCFTKDEPIDDDPIVVVDKYDVTLGDESLAASATSQVVSGTTVTITVTVPEGKVFEKLLIGDEEFTELTEDNTYTFTITKNVNITVTYTDVVVIEKFNVTLTGEGLDSSALLEVEEGTEVTLTVVVPEGKVFEKLLVNEVEVVVVEGIYVFTIAEDVTAVVSYTDEVVEPTFVTVVVEYKGATIKFSEINTDNNAALIGLDPEIFQVIGNVLDGGSYTNPVGLNADGTIRLYSSKSDGNGNILSFEIASGYVITGVAFEFSPNPKAAKEPNKAELKLGSVVSELTKAQLIDTVSFEGLDITTFSLQNNDMNSNSTQVWIKTITITYDVVPQ